MKSMKQLMRELGLVAIGICVAIVVCHLKGRPVDDLNTKLDTAFIGYGNEYDDISAEPTIQQQPSELKLANSTNSVKVELSTDIAWETDSNYGVELKLPKDIFVSGAHNTVRVYYPQSVKAGEEGTIVMVITSDNHRIYCGICRFVAIDDLHIVYGDDNPKVASGGEIDCSADSFMANFYTSATNEHYDNRRGFVGRSGADGYIDITFIDTTSI